MLSGKRVFLIVSGGISAYKSLDLIRRLREKGASVRCCLTANARKFVTETTVTALSQTPAVWDQFAPADNGGIGHIELARACDLVIAAPATADLMARMAAGIADELATTLLLAADRPILIAPAMNVKMWLHPATRANLDTLVRRGVRVVGPNEGPMACNEFGPGRMAEVAEIVAAAESILAEGTALAGRRVVVTSGPTVEPIDPVRVIANRSSGKQGHAIASACARLGADVVLVSGPVALADPAGMAAVHVETARQMLAAVEAALPADVLVCAAAVADWGVKAAAPQKLKKVAGGAPPVIELVPNPDILATISARSEGRPRLVVGFAAETENLIANARAKREKKGCDWILANDVSPESGTFGGDATVLHLVSAAGCEDWPTLSKVEAADRLAHRIAEALS